MNLQRRQLRKVRPQIFKPPGLLNRHYLSKRLGAALWYIRQLVVARAVRSTFGIILWRPYDPNTFHRERKHRAKLDHDGSMKMVDLWETWLKKVCRRS